MTDLREAYPNLERFGQNVCEGQCIAQGMCDGLNSDGLCNSTQCTRDNTCPGMARCANGNCASGSGSSYCCPWEGFSNVRRPRRAIRRRERFGDCSLNGNVCGGTPSASCQAVCEHPTCACNGPNCATGMGKCGCACL